MPKIRGGHHAFFQHSTDIVFAAFELVANNGHFRIEQFLFDAHVDHAFGFKIQRPPKIFIGCIDRLEVVRAVERRRSVPSRAVIHQFFLDLTVVRALDEIHVFEQVRHTGFAIAFVARSDQVSDIDRDHAAARVGKQQNTQPIGI